MSKAKKARSISWMVSIETKGDSFPLNLTFWGPFDRYKDALLYAGLASDEYEKSRVDDVEVLVRELLPCPLASVVVDPNQTDIYTHLDDIHDHVS